MNSKNTHKFKAFLALLLSISMLFSMVVTSFAAIELSEGDVSIEDINDDGTIHYVAFGDSVTNGFGLAGYTYPIPESEDKNSPNGFQVDTITAYPNLIREALANYYGEDYTVTYEPLALSGMRLGDLRMILTSAYETKEEGRYDGDYYRNAYKDQGDNELWQSDVEEWLEREYYMYNAGETEEDKYSYYVNNPYYLYSESKDGNVKGTRNWLDLENTRDLLWEEYTENIREADVLSIDLGTNDFGTFLTSRLQMLVGMDDDYANVFDPNLPQIDFSIFLDDADAAALKATFKSLVDQFMPVSDQNTYFMNAVIEDLAETLVYGLMAFAYNFDASMEEIYKLNEDVQVMVIDCYNMMAGTTFEGLEVFGGVDILEVYDTFVDIANLYTRSLSPWASRLVHIDIGKVGSEDYPVLFLEYFLGFDESIEVNGKDLIGWAAFEQKYYNDLIKQGYKESEAEEWAAFYTNEAKEAVERFVMDARGMRDEYAAWAPYKKGIEQLDSIVNNLQSTIKANFFDPIVTTLDGVLSGYGYDSFEALVEASVSGVELVETAVSSVQLVKTELLPVIVDTLVPNLVYESLIGKDAIISIIKSELANYEDQLPGYLKDANGNVDSALPELIYDLAKEYQTIEKQSGKEAAEKATVLSIVSYALGKMDPDNYSGEAADQMAAIAYEMEVAYTENNSSYEAAMEKYFDLTQGEADYSKMVSIVYNLNEMYYNAIDNLNKTEAEAMDYAIVCMLADYLVFDLYINVQEYAQGFYVAGNLYDIYKSVKASTDSVLVMPGEGSITNLLPYLKDINDNAPKISAELAALIEECYLNYYDGQYYNETVKSVVIELMQFIDIPLETAESNYELYSMYCNVPYVFAEIAEKNTIYLDALLGAISSGDFNPSSIVSKFMAGSLVLDPPAADDPEYAAKMAAYKQDLSFMVLYVRMLSLDGLFMHPGTEGQSTFGRLVTDALDEFVPNFAEGDDVYELKNDGEYKVLAIGDEYITNVKDCYAEKVAAALGGTVEYQSYPGWTVGETLTFANNNKSNISGYDLILLNVGAWNIGYLAKYLNSNGTAPVDLTDIDILDVSKDADGENSIGERFNDLLGGDDMMLMAKAMMYGYADFTGNIEPLVEKLLSTGATVVLVGLDKLMSDGSVFALGETQSFKLDLLIEKLTNDFNGHMEVIADKYENCYFADISGVNTGVEAQVLITPNGVSDSMATMMSQTLFNADDHTEIAEIILCDTLGIHAPSELKSSQAATCLAQGVYTYDGCGLCGKTGAVTRYTEMLDHAYIDEADGFIWYKDDDDNTFAADAMFNCINGCCDDEDLENDNVVYKKATVTIIKDTATCEEAGEKTITAVVFVNDIKSVETKVEYSPAKGHAYGTPTWEWTGDKDNGYTKAVATFVCEHDEEHVSYVETTEFTIKEVTKPTCTGVGENEYTATVEFNGEKHTKTAPEYVVVDMIAHVYDKPVWSWADDYSEATATFDCTACDDVQVVEAKVESETTDSTCKVEGKVVYTATAVFGDEDEEFTDSKSVTLELGDHDYVDYICSVCGAEDPAARPDESGDCVYVTEEELDADGVYTLTLGGEEVGEFEFVAVDGGWTIADENGNYLAIADGELVYGSDAFVWTFEDGMFSAEETIVEEVVSGGFWGGLFGGETEPEEITTKYYLAAYDGILILAENGEEAEFSVKHHDNKHSYDDGVVTEPTCEDKGYTTYTCEKCGEECVYNERETVDHKYVDGECEYCGKEEDSEEEPEDPEVPEEPVEDCIYLKEVELEEDGSYIVSIGGVEVGKYTITAVDDGWTILDEKDETYLAVLNGMLVYTDEEFVWTYDEEEFKFFYEDIQTVTSTGGFWGGLFGGSGTTETVTTVYYIIPEEDKLVVSEDGELAEVILEIVVVEEGHDYVDGVCEDCGKFEDDSCVHFEAVELEENGEYVLIIGDEHLGFHTFENVDEYLWTIVNEDGNYVALEDGEVVYTSEEFVWTYDSEKSVFSAEIVTAATSGGFWGGLFGGNASTTVETYYLIAEDGNLAVSLKDKAATAEFLVETVDEHIYGDMEDYYGFGRSFCENCGTVKFEIAE